MIAELNDVLSSLANQIKPAVKVRAVVESIAHAKEHLADLGLYLQGVGPTSFSFTGTSRHPRTTMP